MISSSWRLPASPWAFSRHLGVVSPLEMDSYGTNGIYLTYMKTIQNQPFMKVNMQKNNMDPMGLVFANFQ